MQCPKCQKRNAQDGFSECARCFCRNVDERVRKEVRAANVMGASREVVITAGSSAPARVLEKIVRRIAAQQRTNVRALSGDSAKKDDGRKILVPATMDELNEKFMAEVLGQGDARHGAQSQVFALRKITRDECERYCVAKGIAFEAGGERSSIAALLQHMQKAQPKTRHGIAASREWIDENH